MKSVCSFIFAGSLTIFATTFARADTVIFLGGWGSTNANMNCWKRGAERQAAYSGYKFRAIAYPSGISGSPSAINPKIANAQISEALGYINSHPDEKITLVAHSAGSTIAFMLADQIKNPANVSYVNLSGFSVPKKMYRLKSVTSIDTPSSYGNCPSQPRWCRHFSLVNKSVPNKLSEATFARAYDGCSTNLSWLKPKRADEKVAETTKVKTTTMPTPNTGTAGAIDDEEETAK